MPDIEVLEKIADVLNVPADCFIGQTNTTTLKEKVKTVCGLTGLSDGVTADFIDLCEDIHKEIFATAYKQYFLIR